MAASGCAGSSGNRPVPTTQPLAVASAPAFAVPAKPSSAVPRRPSFATPAKPSAAQRAPASNPPHPAFFAGEVPLSNGVYYLELPNGNVFGYFAYLPDSNYIYHFDAGYEYVIDANDAQGGVYFYDFASTHWWYTSRTFSWPYLYDFSLNANLYYYPGSQPGTYTKNPRYFYNFGTGQIIELPAPAASPGSLEFGATGAPAAKSFTATEPGYSGSFTVDASNCSNIATVAPGPQANSFTVTPVNPGSCNLNVTDSNNANTRVAVSVTTTVVGGQ